MYIFVLFVCSFFSSMFLSTCIYCLGCSPDFKINGMEWMEWNGKIRIRLATFSRYVAYSTVALLACRPKLQPKPKPELGLKPMQYIHKSVSHCKLQLHMVYLLVVLTEKNQS